MNSELQSWDDLASLDPKENANNLIIFDGNNLGYRWIGRSNYGNFKDDYIKTVRSLAKSYDAIRIIVCFDFGKSYYRKNLIESYKESRKPPKDEKEVEKYKEFFDCLNNIIDDFPLEYYKSRGIEADDLITYLVEKEKNNYDHTWIISSDRDLYQLLDNNVSIFNLYSRREINPDSLLEDRGITISEFLLAKIIEGDKSDDIVGIEGIGEKRSAGIARDYITLTNLIDNLPIKGRSKYIQNLNKGKDILLLNEKLIDLKKYNEKAIKAGKDGDEYWRFLNEG